MNAVKEMRLLLLSVLKTCSPFLYLRCVQQQKEVPVQSDALHQQRVSMDVWSSAVFKGSCYIKGIEVEKI